MSTRRDITEFDNSEPQGFEGTDTPDDFKIPPCTVEDVDRAVFNLFDQQLPLQAKKNKEGSKRIPVIFATGERFAVLRRKQPLRDRNGATILPLISIMRTGITQDPSNGMGPGQTSPIVIKRRISKESQTYKRLINSNNLSNSDNMATPDNNVDPDGSGATPGTLGSRREREEQTSDSKKGNLLKPTLGTNIYETLTIPPVKYYTATYDITFWSQYTQEMNEMIMTVMSLYQNRHRRNFKLETDKGYWFVGYVGSDFNQGENVDDFTDDERIIRYSFEISVNAYVIAPEYPGSPAYVRRYVSAPTVTFDTFQTFGKMILPVKSPGRADPNVFLLEDLYGDGDERPNSGVGARGNQQLIDAVGAGSPEASASVGGHVSKNAFTGIRTVRVSRDPFTGEERQVTLAVKGTTTSKGETVYKEQTVKKLGSLP